MADRDQTIIILDILPTRADDFSRMQYTEGLATKCLTRPQDIGIFLKAMVLQLENQA